MNEIPEKIYSRFKNRQKLLEWSLQFHVQQEEYEIARIVKKILNDSYKMEERLILDEFITETSIHR